MLKALPLLGLIQGRTEQKRVSGPTPVREPGPGPGESLNSANREQCPEGQADWLLETIRRMSAEFLTLADQKGLTPPGTRERSTEDRRNRALLLSYKLTLTAWHSRESDTTTEVRTLVRGLVGAGLLREIEGVHGQSGLDPRPGANPKSRATRRAFLDPADSDISAALIRFEAGLPSPLSPFYGDLAPAFGGPCPPNALESRYGRIVRHLFETLLRKFDARERAERRPLVYYARNGPR